MTLKVQSKSWRSVWTFNSLQRHSVWLQGIKVLFCQQFACCCYFKLLEWKESFSEWYHSLKVCASDIKSRSNNNFKVREGLTVSSCLQYFTLSVIIWSKSLIWGKGKVTKMYSRCSKVNRSLIIRVSSVLPLYCFTINAQLGELFNYGAFSLRVMVEKATDTRLFYAEIAQ